MSRSKEKVVVAMSGGVDSSVAACLLVEQGYEVIGLFMRHGVKAEEPPPVAASVGSGEPVFGGHGQAELAHGTQCSDPPQSPLGKGGSGSSPRAHQGCCSASDAGDARFVAGMLGIPFYALNFEDEFSELIDYFVDEYARGRTPNPCVVCNDRLKFGKIVEYADAVGARYIATGHYARTVRKGDRNVLLKACDARKDQSYVLFGLSRDVLDRVMFPIGNLTKQQVREIASRRGFPNCDKPDSVEICFVPDRDYARVVRERRPDSFIEGDVVDDSGQVVGRHKGLAHYTIGQRRGLGIAAGHPIYITGLNVESNTIVIGDDKALERDGLVAERVRFLIDPPTEPFTADVKIRYLHEPAPATVVPMSNERVRVEFDVPQRAVTPGQAVVFYDGEAVLGGGWIDCGLRREDCRLSIDDCRLDVSAST